MKILFKQRWFDLLKGKRGTSPIIVLNWGGGDEYRIERFEFADWPGTVWDAANDAVYYTRKVA